MKVRLITVATSATWARLQPNSAWSGRMNTPRPMMAMVLGPQVRPTMAAKAADTPRPARSAGTSMGRCTACPMGLSGGDAGLSGIGGIGRG